MQTYAVLKQLLTFTTDGVHLTKWILIADLHELQYTYGIIYFLIYFNKSNMKEKMQQT